MDELSCHHHTAPAAVAAQPAVKVFLISRSGGKQSTNKVAHILPFSPDPRTVVPRRKGLHETGAKLLCKILWATNPGIEEKGSPCQWSTPSGRNASSVPGSERCVMLMDGKEPIAIVFRAAIPSCSRASA